MPLCNIRHCLHDSLKLPGIATKRGCGLTRREEILVNVSAG
jgi:hypothetical protein